MQERNCKDDNRIQAIQYVPVEETEQIEKYQPGGYHPVQIDDRFGPYHQYQVVHKLGFGGHSTTWLARDETQGGYVALKIGIASESGKSQESRMLQYLGKSLYDKANTGHVPTIRDAFTHNGINGTHDCLVTQLGTCSLAASKSASKGIWLFNLAVARSITAQLIHTTALLHSRGIVHGGKPPEAWWNSWLARGEFFDADGQDWDVKSSRISDGKYCALDARVGYIWEDREGEISDEELADLLSMLTSMIRWRPEDRTSAQALLVGKWMMKWGL